MNLLLSIVVPVYNTEKYLSKCIESILGQSYSNIELILVDDGSTDASSNICDMYKNKDTRVVVIHKKNEGPIIARLIGIMCAKGQYVTFADSDDWIDASMYEKLLSLCMKTDADVIMSGIYRYFSEEKIVKEVSIFEEGLYDREKIEEEELLEYLENQKYNGT